MNDTRELHGACAQCGGTSLRRDNARSAFWHGDRLVVIEDIPALVCDDCSEQFFDDRTVMLIDRLRGEGFPPERASREIVAQVFTLQAGLSAGEAGRE
jgi:YgiT-type zinc finger domain-containing protein